MEAIRENLETGITLAQLAGEVGLSPSHFETLFRRSTGLSPHQYLIRCRVERARDLLGDGTVTLSQVAARCGFSDQSHLGRHFKRLVGMTPGAYRRRS